jgi:diacylglycerol O-acyltransferase / wax synthase
MAHRWDSDGLRWGDALFLYLEREGMPLHIAGVSMFEGVIPLKACSEFIESKLPLLPHYLQRVVVPPFNMGLPTWEYDPEFDMRNHIREVTLKHGTDAEFKAVAGKILSKTMDRQRPLWDLTLVRGLKGNRTGVISRVHHCLADGIAGVGIMSVLMDPSRVVKSLPKKKRRLRVPPPRPPLTSLLDGLISSYSNVVEGLLSAQSDVVSIAQRVAGSGGDWPAGEFARLLPELTTPTERLRFNVISGGPQKFTWAEIPLGEVKAIRQACGASVNDVVLALVTATIRRYCELHGDSVKRRLLRIMVPVNVRGSDSPGALGNRVSLLPVTIPLDLRNPRKLLSAVHQRTEFLKRTHVAELISLAGTLLGTVATPLQALVGPVASQLPLTPFNLVCTNVPGPQYPLYLLGHKMLCWYPYVPIGGDMALNCAILSYNGTVYFGFTGDVHAAPDLRRLETLLRLSFTELRKAAGVSAPRKKSVRAKAQAVSTAARAIRAPASSSAASPLAEPASTRRPAMEEDKTPSGLAAD